MRGYLIATLAIGGIKNILNIRSAGLGESMICSLREKIFSNSSHLRPNETLGETVTDKSGTVVTMISSEAEAVGKFIGDCSSTPVVQAGTLLRRAELQAVYRAFSRAGRLVHRRPAGDHRS